MYSRETNLELNVGLKSGLKIKEDRKNHKVLTKLKPAVESDAFAWHF